MRRSTFSFFTVPAIIAIVFLWIGIYLTPKVNPYFAGVPQITRWEARQVVDDFIAANQMDVSDFYVDTYFAYDQTGLDYLIRNLGFDETISLAKSEQVPLSGWRFFFYRDAPRNSDEEHFEFRVSPSGHLTGFRHRIPDSTAGANLDADTASEIAKNYLIQWPNNDFSAFELEQSVANKKAARTDYSLTFFKRDPSKYFQGSEAVQIGISGDQVTYLLHTFREPTDFATTSGIVGAQNVLLNTLSAIVYVVLTFLVIAVFLKKYHAGEIGVRQGFRAGALVFVLLLLYSLNAWGNFARGVGMGQISYFQTKLITLGLQMVTSWLFISLNVMSGWNAALAETRLLKPRLLSGLQSLLNKRLLTGNIGREVPIGFVFGTVLFGGVQLLQYGLMQGLDVVPRIALNAVENFSMVVPALSLASNIAMSTLFGEILFSAFLVTYLIRKINSPMAAILVTGAAVALFSIFFNETIALWPSYFTLLPFFIVGVVQAFIFWRFGLLAAFTSSALYAGYIFVAPLLASNEVFFQANAIAIIAGFVALLIIGLIGLFKGKVVEFAYEEEPAHIRRIKEKTRLAKELEIARRVQLGLLPKEQPALKGFDISGVCMPAQEVGGDYFDFISLENGDLGIAVGDVSGKGVPAAIYMTLTKGILQSHAESTLSPKQVLSKVNNLMYRTIERSWYVSMFYAVLDTRKRILRYARAGHNPALMLNKKRGKPQLLQTAGIGLGLDVGDIFTKTLAEGELQLEPGDTLVFYTDGFTEAMNEAGEEFGEERFFDLLNSEGNGSAEGLLKKTISAIKAFSGEAPQHDDMTMVVLKVY